jgi:hypothetical protein
MQFSKLNRFSQPLLFIQQQNKRLMRDFLLAYPTLVILMNRHPDLALEVVMEL